MNRVIQDHLFDGDDLTLARFNNLLSQPGALPSADRMSEEEMERPLFIDMDFGLAALRTDQTGRGNPSPRPEEEGRQTSEEVWRPG